jgi:ABC-type dipeptide/oligopeptide/nickel transport system permease component
MSSLARLKGLPGYVVPAMHLAGVNLVVMINAAVIIEVIFARPGIGRLLYEGIFRGSLAAPVREEIAPRCTVACHLN